MPDGTGAAATAGDGGSVRRVTIPVRSVVKVDLEAPQYQVAAKNPRRVEIAAAVGFLLGAAGFAGFGAAYWQNYSNFWLGAVALRSASRESATGWWRGAST